MQFLIAALLVGIAVVDVFAIVSLVRSDADTASRTLWIAAIVVFPVIGFVAWLFTGPKESRTTRPGTA